MTWTPTRINSYGVRYTCPELPRLEVLNTLHGATLVSHPTFGGPLEQRYPDVDSAMNAAESTKQ